MAEKLKIRDFIYLDVERMKSIFSQIYEGLIESSTEEKGNKKNISAKGEGTGGIPGFAKLKGEVQGGILWENKETETKTLHDHMYNIIEKVLKDQDSVYIIKEDKEKIKKAWKNGTFSNEIPDNSFVLIKGRVMLDDYKKIEMMADNFDILEKMIGGNQNPNFNAENMEDLSKVIKVLYPNELFIKVLPYSDNSYLKFIGNLNREFLRDSMESITFKYGTNPVSDWYLFGQISSIFPKDYNPQPNMESKYGQIIQNASTISTTLNKLKGLGYTINSNYDLDQVNIGIVPKNEIEFLKSLHLNSFDYTVLNNAGIDTVLESVFNAFRVIDYFLSAKFPSITVTPIAVYRGE